MKRHILDQTIKLASEQLEAAGMRCIEADWVSDEDKLIVYIDRPGGVDMKACVEATRMLQEMDILPGMVVGDYELEVSSPGIERPIRLLADFEANVGKKINILVENSSGGLGLEVVGFIDKVNSDAESISLRADSGAFDFTLPELIRAKIVYDWNADGLQEK